MLSNIFKSGIPGVRTVSQEPFVIDANSRVIEPPKPRVIRPKNDVPEGSAEAGDTFEAGITEMAATINLEEHKELLDDAMEKAKLLQDDARERAQKIWRMPRRMQRQFAKLHRKRVCKRARRWQHGSDAPGG